LERNNKDQFKICYTVTQPIKPTTWEHHTGHVNLKLLKNNLPKPSEDTLILVCGPKGFVEDTCVPLLQKIGYSKESIFSF
jgi:NAD(P)H-flavin reductase